MNPERPILFSAPMVRAILDGSKTQTRRIVKLPRSLLMGDLSRARPDLMFGVTPGLHIPMADGTTQRLRNPWGWPESSTLWVREAFTLEHEVEGGPPPFDDGRPLKRDDPEYGPSWWQPHYRATDPDPTLCCESDECRQCERDGEGPHWKPSIHMPRWASRITLKVTGVRVERLQDISAADAIAEGIAQPESDDEISAPDAYRELWLSIHGAGSWELDPWVWVVTFKRITP